jgi:hypothetical protein
VGEEELEEEELTCGVAQIQIWRAGAATGARRKETLGGTPRERGRWMGWDGSGQELCRAFKEEEEERPVQAERGGGRDRQRERERERERERGERCTSRFFGLALLRV